jgi:hypothetical protein
MMQSPGGRPRRRLLAFLAAGAVALTAVPAALSHDEVLGDFEVAATAVKPNAEQRAQVADLGARATWNRYGTPHTIIRDGGYLATDVQAFTALRRFEILACNAAVENCAASISGFDSIYVSPADAFPGFNPRPVAPEMILRSFSVPQTRATHIQIRVLANQCTGNPAFRGEQDADPANGTDCRTGSPGTGPVPVFGDLPQVVAPRDDEVSIAELQVFGRAGSVRG